MKYHERRTEISHVARHFADYWRAKAQSRFEFHSPGT